MRSLCLQFRVRTDLKKTVEVRAKTGSDDQDRKERMLAYPVVFHVSSVLDGLNDPHYVPGRAEVQSQTSLSNTLP